MDEVTLRNVTYWHRVHRGPPCAFCRAWARTASAHLGEGSLELQLEPKLILSSHLPPARGLTQQLLANLELLPDAPPFTGPDQAAMERMLAELTAVPA